MKDLIKKAQEYNNEIIDNRRYFHMYPEISNSEVNTAKKIEEYLNELDIEYEKNVGGYGIIATIGNKDGKVIGLRTDMDALQILEKNDLPYKSKNEGIMHACGHDGHMSILLGAAKLLKEIENELDGKVKLIFQPAEEFSPIGGSRKIIESGKIDDVDYIFGLHMWPDYETGVFGIKEGALMASSDRFTIEIIGESSHAAQPHIGKDTIVVGTQFVQNIQNIVSRKVDPLKNAVITVGTFNAGTRYNILANNCKIEGTVRTFDEDIRDNIERDIKVFLDSTCTNFDVKYKIKYERGYRAVINDINAVEYIKDAAIELYGEESVRVPEYPSMIAEDFAFYLEHCPGAFIWFGCNDGKHNSMLHSDTFNLDEENLWKASLLFVKTAINYLNSEKVRKNDK